MSSFSLWKRMMGYVKPYSRWALIAIVGIVGNIALAIAIPRILGDVIDIGLERQDQNYMYL